MPSGPPSSPLPTHRWSSRKGAKAGKEKGARKKVFKSVLNNEYEESCYILFEGDCGVWAVAAVCYATDELRQVAGDRA